MSIFDDYRKKLNDEEEKKKSEKNFPLSSTSNTDKKQMNSLLFDTYRNEVIPQAVYKSQLTDKQRQVYENTQANKGVYSSPYLKSGREGKSDLIYGYDEWNKLDKEEKEKWFDYAEQNKSKKGEPWQAEYAREILAGNDTRSKTAAQKTSQFLNRLSDGLLPVWENHDDIPDTIYDIEEEKKWMWASLPEEVQNGLRNAPGAWSQTVARLTGKGEDEDYVNRYNNMRKAEEYLNEHYSKTEVEMLKKYAEMVEDLEDVQTIKEIQSDLMASNPIYASVIAPIQQIGADIGASALSAPRTLWDLATERGNYAVVNPYKGNLQKAAEAGRGVQQEILEGLEGNTFMQNYYSASVSTAESAMRLALARGVASGLTSTTAFSSLPYDQVASITMNALMFPSVVEQTATEMVQKGMPANQAIAKAVSAGIFECLFETVSFDKLGFFQEKPIVGNIKTFAANLLKSGFVEGSEEVATDIANELYDYFAAYDYSDFKAYKDKMEAQTGEEVTDLEAWDGYKKEFADKLLKSFIGGAVSGLTMGAASNAQGIANARALNAKGETVSDADAERMRSVVDNVAAYNPNVRELMENAMGNETTVRGAMADVIEQMEKTYIKSIEKATTEKQLNTVMENLNTNLNGLISENAFNAYNAKMIELGKEGADYQTFLTNRDKGNQTTFSDLAYGTGDNYISRKYAEAKSELENITHNPNANMTMQERIESFERASIAMKKSQEMAEEIIINATKQGKTIDAPELRKYVGMIGTENAARISSIAKLENDIAQNPVKLNKGHVFQATKEEVVKRGLLSPEVAQHIRPAAYSKVENTPEYEVLKVLADMTGTNIGLFESDRSGEIQNGAWIDGKNTILVDANSGKAGMHRAIGEVLSHELTHWIRSNNEAGYDRLYMFVRKDIGAVAFDTLVNDKINESKKLAEKYNRPDLELDTNVAAEEVIAEACQRMLASSETFLRYAAADIDGAKSLLSRLKSFLGKLREFFRGEMRRDATRMIEDYEGLAAEWEKALNEAIANANTKELKQDAMIHGFDFESADDAVYRNSWRYNLTDEQIDKYSKLMSDQLGCTVKEAENYFKAADSLSSFVLDPLYNKYLDYDPDGRYTAIKKNADYPQGTVDFTNNCRKRTIFTNVFDRLQKAMPNRIFNAVTLADLRETLKKFGYKVACALCFVEDRRQRMGEIGDLYVKALTNSHKNFNNVLMYTNSKKESYPLLMTQTLKDRYGDRVPFQPGEQIVITDDYVPTQYDIVTYDGFAKLTEEHPTVALGFEAYNNRRGMSSARLIEGRGEYKREILSYTPDQVKRINDLGGLRIFSFSDFEVVHLLDLCQIITDCATVGLKIQTYTKVPAFAKLIRNTNIKCNRSLIPKGKGWDVDAKGNKYLVYDTTEGIDINDPDFFDSTDSENIGNILVGINKEQIRLAMVDDFVDYIIPFHTNQAKKVLIKKGISLWDNYKKFQTDKTASGSPTMVNIYTEVLDKYNPQNKYQFVDAFLRECQSRNITPRFEEFIDKENGKYKTVTVDGQTYMYTPGYEKFLVDFKLFDKQGNILPQKAVFPTIDMEFAKDLMKSEAATAKEQDKVDDAVVNELIEKYKDKNAKFSTRDTEYLNAIGRGDQDAAQRYVDEAAREAGYPLKFMHGTNSFGFTTIEYGQSDDGISFFGTDDEEVASTYIRPMEDEDATPHTYVREIGKPHGKIVSASSSIPELIAEYDRVTGKKSGFRPATQKDIDKLLDTRIATVKRSANDLLQYSIPDNIDTAVKNIVSANTADEIISAAEAIKDEWNIYYNGEYFQQASFALLDLKDMLDSLKNGMKLKADNLAIYDALNIWRTKSDMVDEILDNGTGIGTRGTYELYGTRKNALVIDCMGSQWNSIPVPVMPRGMREDLGDYAKTRDISKWANDHGYGVVIFKEVKDTGQYGSRFTPASTVYAFTRDGGESIKSADTVTYTDDGEIIPPSERFNEGKSDIRYSLRTLSDGTEYVYLDGNIFTKKDGTEMSPQDAYRKIVGKKLKLHDGSVIRFVEYLPGNKEMYDELYKRRPGRYDPDIDIKKLNTEVNKDIVELYKYSEIIPELKGELDDGSHKKNNIESWDTRVISIADDNGAYTLRLAVANLFSGQQIAYAKRGLFRNEELWEKIKKEASTGQSGFKQPSSDKISQSETDVKRFYTRDSEGRELTPGQQEYFAESKVRDENGNLKRMYHGTENAGFTVFDTDAVDDGRSFFFTDDPIVAKTYSGSYSEYAPQRDTFDLETLNRGLEEGWSDRQLEKKGDGFVLVYNGNTEEETFDTLEEATEYIREEFPDSIEAITGEEIVNSTNYAVYLNITNPMIVDAKGSGWDYITPDNAIEVKMKYEDGEWTVTHNGEVVEVSDPWNYGDEIGDTDLQEELDELADSDEDSATFSTVLDETGSYAIEYESTRTLAEKAQEEGYDGVIINNVLDTAIYGTAEEQMRTSTVAIAFNSNQIKSINNTEPTSDDDIRYSERTEPIPDEKYDEMKKHFGTTNNFNVAGYLLKDGKMLDFSGKHWGDKTSTTRQVDHRDISEVLDETENYAAMVRMIANGNIRLMPENGGICLSQKPTEKQRQMLSAYIRYFSSNYSDSDGITVDFDEPGGDTVYSKSYKKGVDTRTVLRDIDNYFKNGRPSDLMQFHTADDYTRFSYRDLANSESEILINALKNDAALVDELGAKQSIEAYAREYNRLKEMENQQIEITKQLRKKDTSPSEREVLLKKMVRLDRAILNKTTELTEMRNQRVIRDLLISEWDKRDTLVAAGRAEERYLTRKALEEKYGKELSSLKEKNRQKIKDIRERSEANKRKESIIKNTKKLMDMMLHPTDKKHIPSVLIEPLTEMLDGIDYWTPKEGRKVTQRQMRLRERFLNFKEAVERYMKLGEISDESKITAEMRADLDDYFGDTLDAEFLERIDELIEHTKNIDSVNDMSVEDLIDLDRTIREILKKINEKNQLISESKYQTIKELRDATVDHLNTLKTVSGSEKGNIRQRTNAGMADSYAFARYAGAGAEEVVDMLSKSFEHKIAQVKEAVEFTQGMLEPYKKQVSDWSKKKVDITLTAKQTEGKDKGKNVVVKMTVGQMMELYLLSKRKQARGHIFSEEGGSGIHLEDRNGKWTAEIPFTYADFETVMKHLRSVPGALKVADALQNYGATTITNWGNLASERMYGFEQFTDPDYWQIRTTGSNRGDTPNSEGAENAQLYKMKNYGRTKEVVANANSAINIGDAFDTWSKTIDEMTSYSSVLPAVTDALRWWNSRVSPTDGTRVKKLLADKLGKDMANVFKDTIIALNGGIMGSDSLDSIVRKLTGKAKAAAVAGNLRVVLQQPTAWTRALAEIEPQYLLKGLVMKPSVKEMQEHSAIAWHKAQGFYSNGLAPSLRKLIIGDASIGETLTEKSLWLAGKADDVTWGSLWNASKAKVEAENKALKKGSDAYWKEVNRVFSNIINNTQVVDTPLTKSTWMRGNGASMFFTAFMAEPTKTYSMVMTRLENAIRNPKDAKAWKAFCGVFAVFGLNAVVNAFAQAIADAARDDDKEKDYWEKYLEKFKGDIVDNVIPLNYIPVIKDAVSIAQGYRSNNNLATQSLNNVWNAYQDVRKAHDGKTTKTLFGTTESVAKAVSSVTGVPFGNVMRIFNSVGNVMGIDTFRRKKYTNSELGRNVVLSIEEGDTAAAEKYMKELLKNCKDDQDKANNYVITYLSEHSEEIDAWADKYMEDATKINEAIVSMRSKYSPEIIMKAIRKSINNEIEDDDDKLNLKTLADSQYTSDDINRMLEKGKIQKAYEIVDAVNEKYKKLESDSNAEDYVVDYLANNDRDIQTWAKKYMDDPTTIDDAVEAMSKKYSRDVVMKAIRKSVNNGLKKDDKLITKTLADSHYTSDDINRMLEKGKISEAQEMIDEVNAYYKKMDSKSTAKNVVTAYWKEKYLAATGADRDRIARMLYRLKNNGKQMFSSKDLQKWVSDAKEKAEKAKK